jgi:hypothetical protein
MLLVDNCNRALRTPVDISQFRQSLKLKWLNYYKDNQHWISRMGIWISYGEHRRPTSSFILGTLAVVEPQLTAMLPLIVDLNHNPDRVVEVLGLNFNPETELTAIATEPIARESPKLLPASNGAEAKVVIATKAKQRSATVDEACRGTRQTEYDSF